MIIPILYTADASDGSTVTTILLSSVAADIWNEVSTTPLSFTQDTSKAADAKANTANFIFLFILKNY